MHVSAQNIVTTLIMQQKSIICKRRANKKAKIYVGEKDLYRDIFKFCLRALLFISIYSINFYFG